MPAATHGPWSPVYTSSNPAPTDGPDPLSRNGFGHHLQRQQVVAGSLDDARLRLERRRDARRRAGAVLPRRSLHGQQCLNRVYAGATVASPAYAPRVFGGPLPMPQSDGGIAAAASSFSGFGTDRATTRRRRPVTPNEETAQATPTTSIGNGHGPPGSPPQRFGAPGRPVGRQVAVERLLLDGHSGRVESVAGAYIDMELAQDVCAAGQVAAFRDLEPAVRHQERTAFASGLSVGGRLVSATMTAKFYGQPLVAWTPAPERTRTSCSGRRRRIRSTSRGKRLTWDTRSCCR